jgi:hypothetical protein
MNLQNFSVSKCILCNQVRNYLLEITQTRINAQTDTNEGHTLSEKIGNSNKLTAGLRL